MAVLLTLRALIIAQAVTFAGAAFAFDATSPLPVNIEASGIGLKGYDPVAYFAAGTPTIGNPEFTANYGGATYHFVSAENREAFVANPARYVPQYGGFCALAMSFGLKVDIDPMAWKVVDGRLYVQANPQAASTWSKDMPGNIVKANEKWPTVKDKPPHALQ